MLFDDPAVRDGVGCCSGNDTAIEGQIARRLHTGRFGAPLSGSMRMSFANWAAGQHVGHGPMGNLRLVKVTEAV